MFRLGALARSTSRQVVQKTPSSTPSCSFHTSSPVAAGAKSQKARQIKKRNLARRAELAEQAERNRPHIVLGYSPGQEALWTKSDLAKLLVSKEELAPLPPVNAPNPHAPSDASISSAADAPSEASSPALPNPDANTLNFGIDTSSTSLLFSHLPLISAKRPFLRQSHTFLASERGQKAYEESVAEQVAASKQLERIAHLSNANAQGIAFENRRRIVEAFSDPNGTKIDTGRSEVQAALFTLRIHDMWAHMTRSPRDIASRRSLRALLHGRAKVLKYLKRVDRDRYDGLLPRIGVDPRAVEGEIILQ